MQINLMNNTSPNNKINKNVSAITTLEGSLKEPTTIMNPVITIEYSNPVGFNYAYFPQFSRYYFVKNVEILRANIMRLELEVDPLETYKDSILNLPVIIDKNTFLYDNYLIDENRQINVKTKTDIINFPNGLLESGEFILITAGG